MSVVVWSVEAKVEVDVSTTVVVSALTILVVDFGVVSVTSPFLRRKFLF
jgi:hypothetical protein